MFKKFAKSITALALAVGATFSPLATVFAEEEKVFNIAVGSEPPTIDPSLASDTTSGTVVDNVFEKLTVVDRDNNIQPAAAESWEMSEDGRVYTFKLREGAVWTNGDPVTAHDFEYGWKRILNPDTASSRANLFYIIEGAQEYHLEGASVDEVGIKSLDDYTLEVTLKEPAAYFLEMVSHYTFAPLNQKAVEADENWATDAGEGYVTNGPFTLAEWNHNSDFVLVKSDSYWDKDNIALDRVDVQIIDSETTATTQFIGDGLDFIGAPYGSVSTELVPMLEESGELHAQPYSSVYWYKLNTEDEIMSNVNIRKALALAIDRQGLIDNVLNGNNTPALGIVPFTVEGFEEDRGYFKDADFETAKEYLAKGLEELGISDPSELTLKLSINTSEMHSAIAQYVQEGWRQHLGINAEIDNTEWQVYLDKVANGDYQVARLGWAADYNDAMTFLDQYYTADGGNNYTGWESDEYKELLDKATAEVDKDKRIEILKEAEALFMEDMPVIPVMFYDVIYASKDYVKGMTPDAIGRYQLRYVDIEK